MKKQTTTNAHRVPMPKKVVSAMSRKALSKQLADTLNYDVDFMRLCMALKVKPSAVDSFKMALVNFYIDYHHPLEADCSNSIGKAFGIPSEIPGRFIPETEISTTGFADEMELFYSRTTTDDIIKTEYRNSDLFDIELVNYENGEENTDEEED